MKIPFQKYQGTGNDFIIIDNRKLALNPGSDIIARLCDRHFGIGADGLMLLSNSSGFDFFMTYYNSDGGKSTMCGNGGRCMILFAHTLGLIEAETNFEAIDGPHSGRILESGTGRVIRLKMKDVVVEEVAEDYVYLNTGSPHFVAFIDGVEKADVRIEGRRIRYSERFREQGTNVDLAEIRGDQLFVRTYERGVEDETLSCGTGVTASALAFAVKFPRKATQCQILTPGGTLKVYYNQNANSFTDIWLEGDAEYVFSGELELHGI